MRPMIPVYAALAVFMATQSGMAQTMPQGSGVQPSVAAPATAGKPARQSKLEQRFAAANTTHDGHLTLEQAKAAKMSATVKNFAAIDRGAKGFVTLDDLKVADANARAAKAAAKSSAVPKNG